MSCRESSINFRLTENSVPAFRTSRLRLSSVVSSVRLLTPRLNVDHMSLNYIGGSFWWSGYEYVMMLFVVVCGFNPSFPIQLLLIAFYD